MCVWSWEAVCHTVNLVPGGQVVKTAPVSGLEGQEVFVNGQ